MYNQLQENDVFGIVKPHIDVHTLGLVSFANLLKECGYTVYIASDEINSALEQIQKLNNYSLVKSWITTLHITRIGFSYRLDPKDGLNYFMRFYQQLESDNMFHYQGGVLKQIFFAGLPDTCNMVASRMGDSILTFPGDESPRTSLEKIGVPVSRLPKSLTYQHEYDSMRWHFAQDVLSSEKYKLVLPQDHYGYPSCGTAHDSYLDRLKYATSNHSLPIIRTHSGPYNQDREEAIKEYTSWVKELAATKLLDVLSIGSSQLTQSHFGEKWEGLPNGGGVPINSATEYSMIKEAASPMLVRTYSGTKDVPKLAEIHEKALNISWHALSFWWFDELDGRGANTLLQNLEEHFKALDYIALTGKPVEPNVPHHFAFRGADDITYIITGYLAIKACKLSGIKHAILQTMFNTPKQTIGIQDLAKARALYRLVKELETNSFHVSLQTRAGLDYFAPDLEKAKVQLAAVTCMMDDVQSSDSSSPEIIHVVNYSEAVRLATPPIIKESIQITLSALQEYRKAKLSGKVPDISYDAELKYREQALYEEAKESIVFLEQNIPHLYSPIGFYKLFIEGFFPVPYLIDQSRKFVKATNYNTALKNGGICVLDEKGDVVNTLDRYRKLVQNIPF